MAVIDDEVTPATFDAWYDSRNVNERTGCLEFRNISDVAGAYWSRFTRYKSEMNMRVALFGMLEKLADGEVLSKKPDLPNVSSGETAGLVRRIARNLVQNVPNVEVISRFDDDSLEGILAKYILRSKILGTDQYSNDMQQSIFASVKSALTLGFDCVVPALVQEPAGGWRIHYDTIHYRDVFPEPGVKDVRQAREVFVRRYLTRMEVRGLIDDGAPGWDIAALRLMMKNAPSSRARESTDHQSAKRGVIPEGYEIITRYASGGSPFLTFCAHTKVLLRVEKNKHPQKMHPVFFLVLEKDDQNPLGKSQVELLQGRQEFQDLMLNGAMKLWYRNINPSIIGYGTMNAVPNLSPGKYTAISNPNARLEPFEVNTQTLMQYGLISQQNLGSMVSMVGAADQQMAMQSGNGMSATPQGVEAQQQMVDITTNNYQKAIESFISHYCSYALTIYFQELKSVKGIELTADTRQKLLKAGLDESLIDENSVLSVDFEDMAVEYFVRVVPGSLVELEDEKQLRVLNELFIPLSQALPALAAVQDPKILQQAAQTMHFIISRQIELSGVADAKDIGLTWKGEFDKVDETQAAISAVEERISSELLARDAEAELTSVALAQLQEQMSLMVKTQQALLEKLGVPMQASTTDSPSSVGNVPTAP